MVHAEHNLVDLFPREAERLDAEDGGGVGRGVVREVVRGVGVGVGSVGHGGIGTRTLRILLQKLVFVLTRNCSLFTPLPALIGNARSTCSTLLKAARALTMRTPKPTLPSQPEFNAFGALGA